MLATVTAAALAVTVRAHMLNAAVSAAAVADRAVVQGLATGILAPKDVRGAPDPRRAAEIERALSGLLGDDGIAGLMVHAARGGVLYRAGDDHAVRALMDTAGTREGATPQARLIEAGQGPRLVLLEYVPVLDAQGALLAAVTLVRDADPLVAAVDVAIRDVAIIIAVAAALLAVMLILVFRAAHRRLGQQTAELIEAARRDPLSGMLNHGTVVGLLSEVLEEARRDAGWIILALLDLDNFRLLNETHGYDIGDQALLEVAAALETETPRDAIVGRYGPDEFLLVGPPSCAHEVRVVVERVRERLRTRGLPLPGFGIVPVTVSVGMASYPEHAAAATELLSAATRMLVEAKAGGGDRVRVDAPDDEGAPDRWRDFDVLQALVVAVDTKDHYTRAHSEDVARHALYVAEYLGLDDAFRRQVRISALLHDVGKIGVPDEILHKPAPLTATEKEVMAQHTILGHLMVSSLPGMELIAAGVRHHHERWDGRGYPDGLAGDKIPRIARIVAVADAYSAMTTSRPYRKALPRDEALRRIADAGGSQLDPQLVGAFVEAIGRLPDEMLPYDQQPATSFWLMRDKVA